MTTRATWVAAAATLTAGALACGSRSQLDLAAFAQSTDDGGSSSGGGSGGLAGSGSGGQPSGSSGGGSGSSGGSGVSSGGSGGTSGGSGGSSGGSSSGSSGSSSGGGSACPGLATLAKVNGNPVQLAISPAGVFWTNFSISESVYSVPPCGGATTTIAAFPNVDEPHGVGVDSASVYWCSNDTGTVVQAPLGGGALVTLVANQHGVWDVAVGGGFVSWDNELTGLVARTSTATGASETIATNRGRRAPSPSTRRASTGRPSRASR